MIRIIKMLIGLRKGIYPQICPSCGMLYDGGDEPLCPVCQKQFLKDRMRICPRCMLEQEQCTCSPDKRFRVIRTYLHIVPYRSKTANGVLPRLKTKNCDEAFTFVSRLLTKRIELLIKDERLQKSDCILTYVPRHPKNVCRYGYDQAQRLAKLIGKATGIGTASLLYRRRGSLIQKRLKANERYKNALSKFAAVEDADAYVRGKTVILIDDVITTGASVNACAKQLKAANAGSIIALSFAKTEMQK